MSANGGAFAIHIEKKLKCIPTWVKFDFKLQFSKMLLKMNNFENSRLNWQ